MARRLSLRELAARVHVTPAYLCDIELGRRFPSDRLLASLGRVLKIPPEELAQLHPRSIFREIEDRLIHDGGYADALRRVLRACPNADDLLRLLDRAERTT